jgi:hypothetical protein
MSTLQAREMDFTPCTSTVLVVIKGYTLDIHTACGGKENTSTSELLTVKRDTISCPQCWWWKGIHPYIYIFDYMKRRHAAPMSIPCWWWKEIHPHVHC